MRFFLILALSVALFADNNPYPNKPIDIIVGFGKGGSVDRMTEILKPFLEKELSQKINIINKKGDGSSLAIEYFFSTKQDGYTIFASSFYPYIPLAIFNKKIKNKLEDFALLNIQWFEFDLIAVGNLSKIGSFQELVETIKQSKTPLKVALMYHSTGEMTLNLLLKSLNLPKENLRYVYFHGGEKARNALINQEVDFLVIGAQGSETVREFINPIAIINDKRSRKWDAPTINEALKPYEIEIPIIVGSMRGYSVSRELKEKFPTRYKKILNAFQRVLAKKKVQKLLKQNGMGYAWLGDKNSNNYLSNSTSILKTFNLLLVD